MSHIGYWHITIHFIFFNHPTSTKWFVSWTVGNRLLKPLCGKMIDWLNFRLGEIIGLIHALEKRYYPNKTQVRYNFGSVFIANLCHTIVGFMILVNIYFCWHSHQLVPHKLLQQSLLLFIPKSLPRMHEIYRLSMHILTVSHIIYSCSLNSLSSKNENYLSVLIQMLKLWLQWDNSHANPLIISRLLK